MTKFAKMKLATETIYSGAEIRFLRSDFLKFILALFRFKIKRGEIKNGIVLYSPPPQPGSERRVSFLCRKSNILKKYKCTTIGAPLAASYFLNLAGESQMH